MNRSREEMLAEDGHPVPAPTKPNGELMTMEEIGEAADRYFAALRTIARENDGG